MHNIIYILMSCCIVVSVKATNDSYKDRLNIESDIPSIPASNYDPKLSASKDPSLQVYREAHKGKDLKKIIQQQNVIDRTTVFNNTAVGSVVIDNTVNNSGSKHTKFVNGMKGSVVDTAKHASGKSKAYDPVYNSLFIPLPLPSLPWIDKEE